MFSTRSLSVDPQVAESNDTNEFFFRLFPFSQGSLVCFCFRLTEFSYYLASMQKSPKSLEKHQNVFFNLAFLKD